jgi:hypothetical protein
VVDADAAEHGMGAREAMLTERECQAAARDGAAPARRERAAGRDVAVSERDRRRREVHDDVDPAPVRFISARDVDASADDWADALNDARSAREDRERSHAGRQQRARGSA